MERIVPRMTCEGYPRYVVVKRDERRAFFWDGTRWTRSLRGARLYDDMADVEAVIHRFQPPELFN